MTGFGTCVVLPQGVSRPPDLVDPHQPVQAGRDEEQCGAAAGERSRRT